MGLQNEFVFFFKGLLTKISYFCKFYSINIHDLFWKKDLKFGFFKKNKYVYLSGNQINRGCNVDISQNMDIVTIKKQEKENG